MHTTTPRVSIGLPVFNGEKYLAKAIDTILAQTYTDFELILADNASTDKTPEICAAYAQRDPRVRYYRNATNVGASKNFNTVFSQALGEYFKWAAHDDFLHPDFLARCVAVLDRDASVVLCFSQMQIINQAGQRKDYQSPLHQVSAPGPHKRFADLILTRHGCFHIWGVVRKSILQQTPLLASYISSDRTLLAELALHGRFYDVPEPLFILGGYGDRSVDAYPFYLRTAWFDPNKAGKVVFPNWRIFGEHAKSLGHLPLPWRVRLRCSLSLGYWLIAHWNVAKMALDVLVAAFPSLWKFHLKAKKWYYRNRAKLYPAKLNTSN